MGFLASWMEKVQGQGPWVYNANNVLLLAFFLFQFRVFSPRDFNQKQSHRSPLIAEGIIYLFLAFWAFISYIFYKYLANSVFTGAKY
jgi:hypothetical protein